jgi:hypothetical protein
MICYLLDGRRNSQLNANTILNDFGDEIPLLVRRGGRDIN